jgi:SAM-dependent methyltransferase
VNIFYEIHQGNLWEGPGDTQSTLRALSYLKNLSSKICILDIGCGPGMQTIDLAKNAPGKIIALDNYKPYLDELHRRVATEKLSDKIIVQNGSMFDLSFAPESFDVIWSEGAIYIIGFEKGLQEWKKLIKRGGYLIASDIAWFREEIPAELQIIESASYRLIAHFPLPDSAWWQNYYHSIEQKIPQLELKYSDDSEAMEILRAEKEEMELFRKYSAFYGYEFYIMQK